MTQESIITALQNGSLTSYEMEDLTGIPRNSIVAACKKMARKKELTSEKIKMGRSWILANHNLKKSQTINLFEKNFLTPYCFVYNPNRLSGIRRIDAD